jgi:hypothetical protein
LNELLCEVLTCDVLPELEGGGLLEQLLGLNANLIESGVTESSDCDTLP